MSEITDKMREHYIQRKERNEAKKKRAEIERKKELEEAKKLKEKIEKHSELSQVVWQTKFIDKGNLDVGKIKLFFSQTFDFIRDLQNEIRELKNSLGFAKTLEKKINSKEIDIIIKNIEKT